MTVSTTTARRLQKVTDNGGVLMLLEINHASFTEPMRLVNDTRNITTLGHEWLGLPFAVTLPNDKAKEVSRAKLQMDNVGRDMTAELEKLPPGASVKATITMVHRSTPGVIDFQFAAPLSGVRVDATTVSATMGRDDIMRMSAVLLRFDPATAPALFTE
ncbi:DUF1833 family protein [Polaromonas sp.]|uniref:DUF1833 family protein n=1 Tax=Polaromonas sp. TaxID=1869339 RepID=UPI0027315DD2|nr:DUF1833 family protein [Polaromonas sp.]MDP1886639.1 DUF1833 family protein [Polaromonas sp.]